MTATGLGPDRPFPGLRPYERPDHGWFFGREEQSFALYRLLDGGRLVAVVGGSGSGKSSVVRAGLLPLLDEETRGPGGRKWRWWQMRPGDTPIARLAQALAGESAEDADATARAVHRARLERLHFLMRKSSFGLVDSLREIGATDDVTPLVLVDQFEELFRFTDLPGSDAGRAARREEAALFVQLLLEAERSDEPAARIVLTMRSDYLGDCARFHGLPEAVTVSQFLVPALSRDQRAEAIRGPVEKAGGSIDDDLIEHLLDDSSEELDQLPVLAHAMMRLWHAAENSWSSSHGNSRRLTMSAYEAIGGLAGALSVHADALLAEPDMASRLRVVEQVFRALSEVDRGRGVRRPLPFDRLLAETGEDKADLKVVLDRLRREDCSFLVPSYPQRIDAGTVIDIAHEALIRRWAKMSARPLSGELARLEGRERESLGWLWAEAEDGNTYRALLNLIGGASGNKRPTLPLDQVEERWAWWTTRNRTAAWAERYADEPGGRLELVRRLFADSRAALKADRRRRDKERRLTEEYERLKLERAEERARNEERQRRELEQQLAAAEAEQRAEEAFAQALAGLVIWDMHGVAALLSTLTESDRCTTPTPVELLSERTGIAEDRLRALGERISCRGKFLRVGKKLVGFRFANPAAAKVAASWSALYRDDQPFGCLIDLRNRYVIPLHGGGALIGRGFQENLRDIVVSRAHLALLRPDGGSGALALELRSVNGTTINGRPLIYGQETMLTSGNVVVLGNVAPLLFVSVDEFGQLAGLDDLSSAGDFWVPTAQMVEGVWGILIDSMRLPPTLLRTGAVVVEADGRVTETDDGREQADSLIRVTPLHDVGIEVRFEKEDAKLLCPMRERDDYGIVDLELHTSYVIPRDRPAPGSPQGAEFVPGRFLVNDRFFEVIACGTAVTKSGDGSERLRH